MADTVSDSDQNGIMEVTAPDSVEHGTVAIVTESDMEQPVVEGVGEDDIIQQALEGASETFNVDDTVQIQYTVDGVSLQEGQFLTAGEEGVAFITSDGIVSGSDIQLVQNFDGSGFQVVNSVGEIDDNVALQIVNTGTNEGRETIVIEPSVDGTHNAMFHEMTTASSDVANGTPVIGFDSVNVPSHIVSANSFEENILAAQTITDTGQLHQVAQKSVVNYPQTIGHIGLTSSPVVQTQPNISIPQNIYPPKSSVPLPMTPKSNAPLGSSTNPIRIIQQGNQYTPVQNLSQEQLQQIMQVVQQQQVSKSGNESSVLYNSQTNTRIVYRVIHPSDLHKDGSVSKLVPVGQSGIKALDTAMKRPYKKRAPDDERIDGPELSREEKEQRKKMRPKTRSGRVSKPPKHMVKDFKHIHVLDYDEDNDDSDGGYSDFKVSEGEGDVEDDANKSRKEGDEAYAIPGLSSLKPKNHKCPICDKAYIGAAGLGRHFRLFPSHGNPDLHVEDENSRDSMSMEEMTPTLDQAEPGDAMVSPTETDLPNGEVTPGAVGGAMEVEPNVPVANGCVSTANSTTSFSEDSRDSTSSLQLTTTPPRRRGRGRPPGCGRGVRGRGGIYRGDTQLRRKTKLSEIVRECSDMELVEIVLPRLVRVITLWEFLLLKVAGSHPSRSARPDVGSMYTEYESLHERVQQLCEKYLEFVPETENNKDVHSVQVQSSAIAGALGLKGGRHIVREVPEAETLCQSRFHTTDQSLDMDQRNSANLLKRTQMGAVSPCEMLSPSKRPKLEFTSFQNSFESSLVKILPNDIVPQTTSPTLTANINKNLNSLIKIVPKAATSTVSTASVKTGSVPVVTSSKQHTTLVAPSMPNVRVVAQPPNDKSLHVVSSLQPPSFKPLSSVGSRLVSSHISPAKSHIAPQKYLILSGKDDTLAAGGNSASLGFNAMNSRVVPATNTAPIVSAPTRTLSQRTAVTPVNCVPLPSAKSDVKYTNSAIKPPVISVIPANSFTNSAIKPPVISILQANSLTNHASTAASVSLLSGPVVSRTAVVSPSSQPVNASPQPVSAAGVSPSPQPVSAAVVSSSPQPGSASSVPVSAPPVPILNNLPPGAIVLQTLTPQQFTDASASNEDTKPAHLNLPVPDRVNQDGESVITITVRNGTICSEEEADYQGVSNVDGPSSNLEETAIQHSIVNTADNAATNQQAASVNGAYLESCEPGTIEMSDYINIKTDPSQSSSTNEIVVSSNNIDMADSPKVVYQPQEPMVVVSNGTGDGNEGVLEYEAVPQIIDETGTVHVPATIYQTDDGVIFIQNPDGTMVQLQGVDGQNIPLEMVQALMSMEGETQFVTEADATSYVNVQE